MEAEYRALSMALQAVIPLLDLTADVSKGLRYFKSRLLTFKATVQKYNKGALILAQLEPG